MANIIRKIKQTDIILVAHAQAMINKNTKRSLDLITQEGAIKSIDFGRDPLEISDTKEYQGRDIYLNFSPLIRAQQTAACINIGYGQVAKEYHQNLSLGLDFQKDRIMPQGIPYSPEFLRQYLSDNKGVEKMILKEVMENFIFPSYHKEDSQKPLIIGVTHRPKFEIFSGMLMGMPIDEISDLAANPLDRLVMTVYTTIKSGVNDSYSFCLKTNGRVYEKIEGTNF